MTAKLETAFDAVERERKIRDKTRGSVARFERAQLSLAGGVSSSLRRKARPYPLYFDHGAGSHIVDVDGNEFLDYTLAWGPLILGHSPPEVIDAVSRQLSKGFTFGAQHDLEYEVAERLTGIIPCADLVCFANSGTEVVQTALRLARAATGRLKFLKFEGHYHGWADNVLVSYLPSEAELRASDGYPVAVGLGQRPHEDVLIAGWNDAAAVEAAFRAHPADISAIICEPMLCNAGCIPPEPGFLEFLRRITREHGALLIFDEVITGFRLHLQGGQGYYSVTPDLATYAKAVGGGAAFSCLAGASEFMSLIATGKVVHAGTLNGNPLALAAVKATLDVLARDAGAIYEGLWRRGEKLRSGLETILRSNGLDVITSGGGPVFQLSFMDRRARNYRDTLAADKALYSNFALALLDEGILAIPDGRWYISTAHSDSDIDATLDAVRRVFA
jgi:glutamate-1-semialdehyde 2,1-aminomutase